MPGGAAPAMLRAMAYLPRTEILRYLAGHPGRWFAERHLANLYPAAHGAVPAALLALVQEGLLRASADERARPLYQLAAGLEGSCAEVVAVPPSPVPPLVTTEALASTPAPAPHPTSRR